MATAKKRKVAVELAEQGMSAFALRKRLLQQRGPTAVAATGDDHGEAQPEADHAGHANQADQGSRQGSQTARPARDEAFARLSEAAPPIPPTAAKREPPVLRSLFRPTAQTMQRHADGSVQLTLAEGERLVVLGSYGVTVREGEVTLAGATLSASAQKHWVHAPQCHGLPVLRPGEDGAIVVLMPHPAAASLRKLEQVSPLFSRLWNEPSKTEMAETTFQIVFSNDGIARSHDLVSPPEWNKLVAEITTTQPQRRGGPKSGPKSSVPVVFVCGPKSSGKSTFSRLLTNRLLTEGGGKKQQATPRQAGPSVAVLDIDPGQPEYGTPGSVSLVLVTEPNLAPPFCHPYVPDYGSGSGTRGNRLVRAHDLAAVSPAADPEHYVACVLDLFAVYCRDVCPQRRCPLVVNTPGWVQGTGLDLLGDLIARIGPSRVVYMSQEGPEETVQGLRAAVRRLHHTGRVSTNKVAAAPAEQPFVQLPSQASEGSSRTAAQLRTMQSLSYFHLDLAGKGGGGGLSPLSWGSAVVPLAAMRPWTVPYAGRESGILGIVCYDYQPAVDLLADAINGTVVSIVAIEDMAAFGMSTTGAAPLDANGGASQSTQPARPPLVHSPEGLPLLGSHAATTMLDPRFSRVLGLALVRGIDATQRELQLLTPLNAADAVDDVLRQGGLGVVLVSGKHDLPTWAYTEDLYFRQTGAGNGDNGDNGDKGDIGDNGDNGDNGDKADSDADSDADADPDDESSEDDLPAGFLASTAAIPWVEALHGSQKRAVGSRVWRVRRDLGRNTGGGGRSGGGS